MLLHLIKHKTIARMTSTFRTMTFNYKLVYTSDMACIEFDSSKKVSQLITELKLKSREKFNINFNYDIEIVEAGNELSSKMEQSELTLEEKYGRNYQSKSFYIRPVIRGVFVRKDNYSTFE